MPIATNPNIFANNPLDRGADKRTDSEWLEARLNDSSSLIVPFWRLNPFVLPSKTPDKPDAIGWIRPGVMGDLAPKEAIWVFLGIDDDIAHFALDISAAEDPERSGPLAGLGAFLNLRDIAPQLAAGDAAILAQAKALIDWHSRHPYCAACGEKTKLADAGYRRICDHCDAEHFPRTDPVVITLVVSGNKCLLARNAAWPANMYSALAGFLEPGESIEEAVVREVREETGVEVGKIRYHSTQPWPYPSSLMIGCIAEAETEEITIDGHEIAEARWVDRSAARKMLDGERQDNMWAPPPMAIAHQLIRSWVFEGAEGKPDYSAYD